MFSAFHYTPLRTQLTLIAAASIVTLGVSGYIIVTSVATTQTLNQARAVADTAEHLRAWTSQYGGIHVQNTTDKKSPGDYLKSSTFQSTLTNLEDLAILNGVPVNTKNAGTSASLETYYWKPPSIVQRELSEISKTQPGGVKFNYTSKSVFNPASAPNPFELEAIEAIDKATAGKISAPRSTTGASTAATEYWSVRGTTMQYARAIIADQSCMACHSSPAAAPQSIKENSRYNGGGGYGYVLGAPAGIVSVSMPVPSLTGLLSPAAWTALTALVGMIGVVGIYITRHLINPTRKLLENAQKMADSDLHSIKVPDTDTSTMASRNEIHVLEHALVKLGTTVNILTRRIKIDK